MPAPQPLDPHTRDYELFTIDEVAALWGCSRRTVDRLISIGAVKYVLLFSHKRVPASELQRWVDKHLAYPPAARPRHLRRVQSE